MNKQIEEMARELCDLSAEYETCEICNSEVEVDCMFKRVMTTMTTNLAKKIFEEIARIGSNSYGDVRLNAWEFAELKKKYESEVADDGLE